DFAHICAWVAAIDDIIAAVAHLPADRIPRFRGTGFLHRQRRAIRLDRRTPRDPVLFFFGAAIELAHTPLVVGAWITIRIRVVVAGDLSATFIRQERPTSLAPVLGEVFTGLRHTTRVVVVIAVAVVVI